jgi:ABC-2 type transport system ATP-binding protein
MTMQTSSGLQCIALTKRFAADKGVFSLNLAVPPSIVLAVVGANGAGKTTLINLCLGYLTPDEGEIWIDGFEVGNDPIAAKARLAYIPEVTRLYGELSAMQNMAFFEGLMGRTHDDDAYKEILTRLTFPIASARDRVATYSKGMRQMVAIAIGLLKGANVFLLDEPTSGLDPRASLDFGRLLDTLRGEGKAILVSSHDLHSVYASADRVGVLHCGRLVVEEPVAAFRERDVETLYRQLEDHA